MREGGGAADGKKTAARPHFGARREREREQQGRHRRLFAGLRRAPLLSSPRRVTPGEGAQRAAGLGWRGAEAGWEDEEGGRR